jgi:ribosome maturation factor RimP
MEAMVMTNPSRGAGSSATARLRALTAETLSTLSLELVHLTYRREGKNWVLRLMIDKEGGVSMDDCSTASQHMGAVLEVEDIIPHTYVLEVTSPGLDRPLFTADDYQRFSGRQAQIRTHRPVNGSRQFRGRLEGCSDDVVTLGLPEGGIVSLPLADIADGRLELDLDTELSRTAPARQAPESRDAADRKVRE